MAEKLDPRQVVTFEELLRAMMCECKQPGSRTGRGRSGGGRGHRPLPPGSLTPDSVPLRLSISDTARTRRCEGGDEHERAFYTRGCHPSVWIMSPQPLMRTRNSFCTVNKNTSTRASRSLREAIVCHSMNSE